MTGGFLDWLGRVVMLVLAGLVTLSIIGSIAAIPSGSIETRIGIETEPRTAEPPLQRVAPKATDSPTPDGDPTRPAASGSAGAPFASGPHEAARWLEAMTYALLALTGIAALATLILWRGLRERRRLADALETIAGRR
jgi:hypothetical protein